MGCREALAHAVSKCRFSAGAKEAPSTLQPGGRCLALAAAFQKLAEPSDSHSPIGRHLFQYLVVSITLKMSEFYDMYAFH